MAYPLVVSLQQTLEPLLDSFPSKFEIFTNSELKQIYEHLRYIKSFFEKVISLEDSNNVEEVERRIKDVLQNTQDLIESHLSDLFHPGPETSISGFYTELVKVNAKLASLVKELKGKGDYLTGEQQPPAYKKKVGVGVGDVAASSRIDFERNNQFIVGMDEEIMMLKYRLLVGNNSHSIQVIPIVGMGGIGKTTLAKQVYLDPVIIESFDLRLFVVIGVEYKLKELLLRLVGQVDFTERGETAAYELGEILYKHLYCRRYLVVLDDIWDTEVLDELRRFFPDNSNGSAIILTTRVRNMAHSGADYMVERRFLDDEKSWELLRKIAFSSSDMEGICPPELEYVGKTIAQNLKGLPLAIVVIGKLLSSSETTVESWMSVAENTHSLMAESESDILVMRTLNLSYARLPQYLKACFLYLGLFPPDSKISTSLLIKLWVAEGFIEGNDVGNKSLEEKAEEYLHLLVDRSLVIVDELRSKGGIKTCRVHDLLLELCVTEARLQKLYHIVNEGAPSFTQSTNDQRRLGIYTDVILGSGKKCPRALRQGRRNFGAKFLKFIKRKFVAGARAPQSLAVDPPLVSGVRSLVFICPQNQQPLEVNLDFRWLRVLHALSIRFWEFPDEVVKLVRLRYLAITYDGELPSSISRLQNLEFLIIHRSRCIESYVFLPLEIWKLQKLRHLECMGFDVPDPSAAATAYCNALHLRKLVTLSGVSARTCTQKVLARMPNLIKLGIWFEPADSAVASTTHGNFLNLRNLVTRLGVIARTSSIEASCFKAVSNYLHRLESFKCAVAVMNRSLGSQDAFLLGGFPYGLRKLTLSGCGFMWGEHMTIVSHLPNLQVLKLRWHAFCGPAWVTGEDGFPSLKFLVLEDLDLEHWAADSYQFPVLEKLHIRRCYRLLEIPYNIGEIWTLKLIVVDDCGESVVESARCIQEDQESMGNDGLQIQIHPERALSISSYGESPYPKAQVEELELELKKYVENENEFDKKCMRIEMRE